MVTKQPTVRELLLELRHELRDGLADIRRRLDELEVIAQRPRVARVIDPARPVESNGGPQR
jgi:hypothetical protein